MNVYFLKYFGCIVTYLTPDFDLTPDINFVASLSVRYLNPRCNVKKFQSFKTIHIFCIVQPLPTFEFHFDGFVFPLKHFRICL